MMTTTTNTDTVIETYERDGVVRVPGLLSREDVAKLRARLDYYEFNVAPTLPPGHVVYEADGKSIRNLFHIEKFDNYFDSLAARPDILALVRQMVHGEPVLLGIETFSKPAKVGSGVPPHQDNAYFCETPPDALTIWIAIDAATLENGPIYYVKGSQSSGVLPHRPSGVAGNSMGLAKMPPREAGDEFCGTLESGDALIHHCQTIHWSAPNKTDRPRCGLLFVYRGAHTATDPALRANYDAARKQQS